MLKIAAAESPQDLADVRVLFQEYSHLVTEALSFQNFDHELDALPGAYAPPGGALLIARDAQLAAGCVALRRLDPGTGEMKRMFVRDQYRSSGLGRRLAVRIIEEARNRKYSRIVLDTLPKLAPAIALYRDLGFIETAPYLAAPTPGALCFELRLS
ncbi:MAG: GNAT family N-acetyltransferase [Candidatus Parcubacteria bacterium]|nr:GNAT family N-acetyltransferase [Burkholderiales bacterium]